jgi:hypothetical protein
MKPPVQSETDLGNLAEIARYMRIGRTKLSAVKKCAARRELTDPSNPSPFSAGLTCKQWVVDWLRRNRDFGGQAVEFPRQPSRTL